MCIINDSIAIAIDVGGSHDIRLPALQSANNQANMAKAIEMPKMVRQNIIATHFIIAGSEPERK